MTIKEVLQIIDECLSILDSPVINDDLDKIQELLRDLRNKLLETSL